MFCSTTNSCADVCQCSKMNKGAFKKPRTEEQCLEDKENVSPVNNETEISLYGNTSPVRICCNDNSPSRCTHVFNFQPLEDIDPNSQDSGFGQSTDSRKYLGSSLAQSFSCESSSACSLDEAFLDFSDLEPLDDNSLPRDFNKLMSGSIIMQGPLDDSLARPLFKRSLSLQPDTTTPNSRGNRHACYKPDHDDARFFFKRRSSKTQSPKKNKKTKINGDPSQLPATRPTYQRSFSSEETIKCALQRSSNVPDLIGDFTKTFFLPSVPGKHSDLKSITPKTLVQLMQGDFGNNIASYKVIDCRYPYEYDGGHINGAINIFTRDQCAELLKENVPNIHERNILVFHCEFSSERGPSLLRFLRNLDRKTNAYPSLTYPEIYLLDGGYKNFFEQYSEMCIPKAYKQMSDPMHKDDMRHFRLKSKTWSQSTSMGRSATVPNLYSINNKYKVDS